ncbi:MAG: URC4/urg3 family protein, partial [Coleofasciculaceae cyanobacterium SM2_1_6]|nr:URC4/urg3 family protein [Coleofasciculaceae cyanobacterium SM2_1_6]
RYPQIFSLDGENFRLGYMVDYLVNDLRFPFGEATPTSLDNQQLPAAKVFQAVLEGLGDIWANRIILDGINLGDVWQHSQLAGETPAAKLVPFHKLSQWLTYSLLEPLQELGIEITHLEEMTGLPEYRNGGLCLDLGLLQPKYPEILTKTYTPESEVVVEWRALTVILLDHIAITLRQQLNLSTTDLPLVKVLEGGTWAAGRKIAAELRPGGIPPLKIQSDGTVF